MRLQQSPDLIPIVIKTGRGHKGAGIERDKEIWCALYLQSNAGSTRMARQELFFEAPYNRGDP
jgi:hypothetical protein